MTGPRRALAGLLLALACTACGQAGPSAQVASPATLAAPTALPPAPPPSPRAQGLLDSQPATLDALRAAQARRPVSVQLDGSDDAAPVEAHTTDPVGGGLDLPDDAATVAWWASGASPGTGAGSVVLAAHVSYDGQVGPFTKLATVPTGTGLTVTSADGVTHRYAVQSSRSAPKTALDRTELFRTTGPPALVLVTCGGAYDPRTRSYADNIVVTATPA